MHSAAKLPFSRRSAKSPSPFFPRPPPLVTRNKEAVTFKTSSPLHYSSVPLSRFFSRCSGFFPLFRNSVIPSSRYSGIPLFRHPVILPLPFGEGWGGASPSLSGRAGVGLPPPLAGLHLIIYIPRTRISRASQLVNDCNYKCKFANKKKYFFIFL